jgi:hypothetical protein
MNTYRDDNFEYKLLKNKKSLSVVKFIGSKDTKRLVLPDNIDGLPVTYVENLGEIENKSVIFGNNIKRFNRDIVKLYQWKKCLIYIPNGCSITEHFYNIEFVMFEFDYQNFFFVDNKKPLFFNHVESYKVLQISWGINQKQFADAELEFDLYLKCEKMHVHLIDKYTDLLNDYNSFKRSRKPKTKSFYDELKNFIVDFDNQQIDINSFLSIFSSNLENSITKFFKDIPTIVLENGHLSDHIQENISSLIK